MAVIRNSVDIRSPQDVVFAYLSDLRSELEWNPACQRMEMLTDGPVGVGSRFRAKWKGGPAVEVEIVAFEPPRTWTAHNGGPVEVTFSGRLDPTSAGTRLTAEFVARPHGWFRVVFPVFLVMIKRQERANMTHLRESLERRSRAEK